MPVVHCCIRGGENTSRVTFAGRPIAPPRSGAATGYRRWGRDLPPAQKPSPELSLMAHPRYPRLLNHRCATCCAPARTPSHDCMPLIKSGDTNRTTFAPCVQYVLASYNDLTQSAKFLIIFQLNRLWEGYPSGQRGQTVNLLALPSQVRILPPPPNQ